LKKKGKKSNVCGSGEGGRLTLWGGAPKWKRKKKLGKKAPRVVEKKEGGLAGFQEKLTVPGEGEERDVRSMSEHRGGGKNPRIAGLPEERRGKKFPYSVGKRRKKKSVGRIIRVSLPRGGVIHVLTRAGEKKKKKDMPRSDETKIPEKKGEVCGTSKQNKKRKKKKREPPAIGRGKALLG